MTSVVLADDQDLVRSGLRALLEARGVEVLGEAEHGRAAIEQTRALRPEVLVMDIRMPVMDGIAATREVIAQGLSARVLILTTYDLDEYVYQALRAGAAGFMLKASPIERLVDAIEVVNQGEALLAPSLTRRLIAEHVSRPPPVEGVPESLRGADRARVRSAGADCARAWTTTSPPNWWSAWPPSKPTSTGSWESSECAAGPRWS